MGRPRVNIDLDLLQKLCGIHCSKEEIRDIIGISYETLYRRYKKMMDKAYSEGRMSIRRKRIQIALSGNVPMLIWLSKQLLGERDRVDHENTLEIRSEQLQKALKSIEECFRANDEWSIKVPAPRETELKLVEPVTDPIVV